MLFSQKVKSFVFVGLSEKEAYLKGCKELAKYTASKKYRNLSFKVERVEDSENTIRFVIYTNIDIGENQKKYCELCKRYHKAFFVNEEYNCSRCNLKTFLKRLQQQSNISKQYYRRMIEE